MSECKEEIAEHQIQAQEKNIPISFFQQEDTSLQRKTHGIPEADKKHKQILYHEEEKVDGIIKFFNDSPTVIKIRRIGKFDPLRSDHHQRL